VDNVLVLRKPSTSWIDAASGAIVLVALGVARVVGMDTT
jgi:hypothetical protein